MVDPERGENATPMTYNDDSEEDAASIATDVTEAYGDAESVVAAGGIVGGLMRDKRGNTIRTCGIAGCQYKTGFTTSMKYHKAAKHGIDVI